MHADRGHHLVALSVNYADVIRAGVNHINLILLRVCRDARGLAANGDGLNHVEAGDRSRSKVDYTYCVALAVGDVGILTVRKSVVGKSFLAEVPPSHRTSDRKQDNNEKDFLQVQCVAGVATEACLCTA